MQATGQYGEVPQYVGSRVGASHGHMFNISHEMSLSSTASAGQGQGQGQAGAGLGHGHGHGLSLSHPPHSQTSQSHLPSQILSTPSQPSFLQSHQPSQSHHHHHPQQVQHGFNMSMGGAAPKTSSSAPLPPLTQQQVLQSAAQQLQADIKQHQQVLHTPHSQQQAIIGEHVQQRNPQNPQQAIGDQGNEQMQPQQQPAVVQASVASVPELAETGTMLPQGLSVGGNKGGITREESLDGDEQDDEGDKGSGGNRWPRQEALALLKIRSEMDAAFRDSSIKGPLWEEVSRKLAEMGYQRNAKKCKEKFENVHKYYKRTKEGKTGRQDGKNYRFFSQLEALYGKSGDNTALLNLSTKSLNSNNNNINNNNSNSITNNNASNSSLLSLNHGDNGSAGLGLINPPVNTILSTTSNNHGIMNLSAAFPPPFNATSAAAAATNAHIARTLERVESIKHESENSGALHCFIETSEDDDDDDEEEEDDDDEFDDPAHERAAPPTKNAPNSKKRKRKPMKKYLAFFEKVMKKVLDKQEHMQQKFLEALERRDQDRMIREEAWKRQEMARLNREHDVRAAERALSVSREASLVALLQKMTGQSIPLPQTSIAIQPINQPSTALVPAADYTQNDYNSADKDAYDPMNKRWPKPEVLALIKLRTSLDRRFHEPGSKAVLWEEISAGMTAEGFARTSKRCKEKWENINKYFKKAKDSKKKRPENAKTCPYFHHLNALYKEGLLIGGGGGGGGSSMSSKHLTVTEKGEEQSEGVMGDPQGNIVTSNNGGDGGQAAQEGDSEAVPIGKEIEGPVSSCMPATASALGTSMASTDAKMHIFMGSVSSEKDANVKAASDVLPLAMDTSASVNSRVSMTSPLLFNLDQGMGSTKGFAQQQENSQAG